MTPSSDDATLRTSTSVSDTAPSDAAAVDGRPRRRPVNVARLIAVVVVLLGGGLVALWAAGAFKQRPHVALVTSGEGPYWDAVIAGANAAAEEQDVELTVIRSKSDSAVQTKSIQDLLARGVTSIAVSPLDPPLQVNILAQTASAGTLVTFDSDSPVSRRLCFVGTDNYAAGRMAGEAVRKSVPDGGEVVICLGFPDKDNTRRRRQGVIDELLERSFEPQRPADPYGEPIKGSKFTIVATTQDDGDRQKAIDVAVKALADHPSVKCVVGLLSYSPPAIMEALKQGGKTGQVQIVGFDVDERTLSAVEAGQVAATIMQDQFGCGYHAVRILADDARGNRGGLPLLQMHLLPCRTVTKDNLAEVRQDLARGGPATKPGA